MTSQSQDQDHPRAASGEPQAKDAAKPDSAGRTTVTMRLRLDRPQKDLVRLNDARTIALLWGREISIETGRPLNFRRAKLWNRAGETLIKILKERDVSEKNPITVDLNGIMKQDKREKKDVLEASYFTIVGDPQRSRPAPKAETVGDGATREGAQQNADGPAQKSGSGQSKSRQKREFEHDMVVTGLLDERTQADGQPVAELAAMKSEEWAKASPEDRESDARMFKVILVGHVAGLQSEIAKAAAWNGPYLDLDQPPVIRVKGTWQKLDDDAKAANAPYREFLFHATSGSVLSGPNLAADGKSQNDKVKAAPVASGPAL